MTGGAAVLLTRASPPGRAEWLGSQPASSGALGITIAIGVCALLVIFTFTVVAMGFSHGSGNDDDHEEGGPGGRGPEPPPDPGPSDPDPPWWPEFERDFARHVAGRRAPEPRPPDRVGV